MAIISGTSDGDVLTGTSGADTIFGLGGGDQIDGGDGDDTIVGGADADALTGGSGADVFRYDALNESLSTSYDVIVDFTSGVDALDLRPLALTSVSLVSHQGGTFVFVNGDALRIGSAQVIQARDILAAPGTAFTILGDRTSNLLIGGAASDYISGGEGDDDISGGLGGDRLYGGAGADIYRYASALDSTGSSYDVIGDFTSRTDRLDLTALGVSSVALIKDNGSTFLFAESASGSLQIGVTGDVNVRDVLTGSPTLGFTIIGGVRADTLVGGDNNDVLSGGPGRDILRGGLGGDRMAGGDEKDIFQILSAAESGQTNLDSIVDFETGLDQIDLGAAQASNGAVSIVRTGNGSIVFSASDAGLTAIHSTRDVNAGDLLFLDGSTNGSYATRVQVVGSVGDDVLIGGPNSDQLYGGDGNDILIGGSGGDVLSGGAGADQFVYRHVLDSYSGSTFDVITDFETGIDKIDVSAVYPGVFATATSLVQLNGSTYIFLPNGPVLGATSVVQAGDIVAGGQLNFLLQGDAGSNELYGADGNDQITGGGGVDFMAGGLGADQFIFKQTSDSSASAPDVILDFQSGLDKIDLTGVHARNGPDSFSLTTIGADTHLSVDIGNDGITDMLIVLSGTTGVLSSDVLF